MNVDEVVSEMVKGRGSCVILQTAAETLRQAGVAPYASDRSNFAK
jgi:hypothetical protein